MTSEILNIMIKDLKIKFPVATIARDLGMSKGIVSEYINNKKAPSNSFKELFENYYNIKCEDYEDDIDKLIEEKRHFKTTNRAELLEIALKFISNKEELMNYKIIKNEVEIDVLNRLIEIKEKYKTIDEYLSEIL